MDMTNAAHRIEFDDLIDIAPANDVDCRGPRLRGLSRWALRATVSVESEDNLYAGLSYDVAAGGIFVSTVDMPPIDARVDVTVTLPDGSELEVTGVVRWIRDAAFASDGLPPGCGIAWKQLPIDAVHALVQFAKLREPLLWLAEVA